jgi:hypothetical protein
VDSADVKHLLLGLHQEVVAKAVQVNTLRAKVNQLEVATNEMALAQAEQEPALLALGEIETYLMEKVRVEREACAEPGMWSRTTLGNSVALTLYQDLANQLVKIRKSYGL